VYGFFYPTITSFSDLPLTVDVIAFFLSGTVFFGFIAFIPHVFLGLALGTTKNAAILVYVIPLTLSTYYGIQLGMSTYNDFNNHEYLTEQAKKIFISIILIIILAIIIEQIMPYIIEIWPTQATGLEMKQESTIFGMIDSLRQFIK
jgi:glycosidase